MTRKDSRSKAQSRSLQVKKERKSQKECELGGIESYREERFERNVEGGIHRVAVNLRGHNAQKDVLDRCRAELRTNLDCRVACLTW